RHLFAPAGMTASGSLPETDVVPGRAVGYASRGGAWISAADTLPWRGTAAGGGYSTVRDLLRFIMALQSGKLLSHAMVAAATSNQSRNYG
ncbi:serine hydrolase, partial [Klebsiella pneumoniae]|uniref:serine hydrolase n=1 Tax=Klebsiella pneumoniae TaxID=573 RepID=UPI0013D328B5